MAVDNEVIEQPAEPVRVPVVAELGLAVRVYQGALEGAYGVISAVEQGGAYVFIERNGHEFGELTINLEAN